MISFTRRLLALISVCISGLLTLPVSGQPLRTVHFEEFLAKRFSVPDKPWDSQAFCPTETSLAARRVLDSYGAMYSASDSLSLPTVCIYDGEAPVRRFQKMIKTERVEMPILISLQVPAAVSLRSALDEAAARQLRITPLDGAIAGGRTYGDTLMLWNSRVFPALSYWNRRGRLSTYDLDQFARMELSAKIRKILEWEERGIYFSTDRSKSILTSTAPPGSSQHIALLAFDVVEYWNPEVRDILNRNGWYQTVIDDAPHFTFLGLPEAELPGRGLKMVYKAGHNFWVPNLAPRPY